MIKAIFPGSFDPITEGHLNIIDRASHLFDELIVAVSVNTSKKTLFNTHERYQLVQDAVKSFSNVTVVLMSSGLTVNLVKKFQANIIVRGIRNSHDFIYEQQIAMMNKQIAPKIETFVLFSSPKYIYLSSSLIREIAMCHGDLKEIVPQNVDMALKKKYRIKKGDCNIRQLG